MTVKPALFSLFMAVVTVIAERLSVPKRPEQREIAAMRRHVIADRGRRIDAALGALSTKWFDAEPVTTELAPIRGAIPSAPGTLVSLGVVPTVAIALVAADGRPVPRAPAL